MTYSRKLLVLALAAYLCLSHAPVTMAGKPTKPGGGGGGTSTPSYTFVKLDYALGIFQHGNSGYADLNEFGSVVGAVQLGSTGANQAAYWNVTTSSSMLTVLDKGLLEGPYYADGINDVGEIVGVGYSSNATPLALGLYWSRPLATPLVLPPLSEGESCHASDINNQGLIIGSAWSSANNAWVAVAWRVIQIDGAPVIVGPVELPNNILPHSEAVAINECDANGVAAAVGNLGASQNDNDAVVKWNIACLPDGSIGVIGNAAVLDFASASGDTKTVGVNSLGTVCGYYSFDVYAEPQRATVWTGAGPRTLADPSSKTKLHAPFNFHIANDLNDAGMIVGNAYRSAWRSAGQAVLWTNAETQDPIRLETLLPKNQPFTSLSQAVAINNVGQILGFGYADDELAGFVAIPK